MHHSWSLTMVPSHRCCLVLTLFANPNRFYLVPGINAQNGLMRGLVNCGRLVAPTQALERHSQRLVLRWALSLHIPSQKLQAKTLIHGR